MLAERTQLDVTSVCARVCFHCGEVGKVKFWWELPPPQQRRGSKKVTAILSGCARHAMSSQRRPRAQKRYRN